MTPRLVQIERIGDINESPWYGFVHSETESLMLLQLVSNRYDLDGYRCIRKKDIHVVSDEFTRKDFVQRALRCKGLQPESPKVELVDDIRVMMQQIPSGYEIVTIHRELVRPDECEIGKLCDTTEDKYTLDWITPDGEWEPDDRPFKFTDVTRLDWGDEYSQTLLLVDADRKRG